MLKQENGEVKKIGGYGETDVNDLWGVIQNNKKYNLEKWFVPSRAEWSAFGDMLYTCNYLPEKVTTSNYKKMYGLKDWYWSSSQRSARFAWTAFFDCGYMNYFDVNYDDYVRLSATF